MCDRPTFNIGVRQINHNHLWYTLWLLETIMIRLSVVVRDLHNDNK